jgi:hypothetical protein
VLTCIDDRYTVVFDDDDDDEKERERLTDKRKDRTGAPSVPPRPGPLSGQSPLSSCSTSSMTLQQQFGGVSSINLRLLEKRVRGTAVWSRLPRHNKTAKLAMSIISDTGGGGGC